MSDHTAPSLAKIDQLRPLLTSAAAAVETNILDDLDALRRAVAAFHMEAIRFRMYSVDRLLRAGGDAYSADAHRVFGELRQALEAAGFHTRSHATP